MKQYVAFVIANVWALGYCLASDQSPGWYLVPIGVCAAVAGWRR